MSAQTMLDPVPVGTGRHLLLAVDESENSRRAVLYVADFFGDHQDVAVTILSILPEPSEDYFASEGERRQWLEEKTRALNGILGEYRKILAAGGIPEGKIETRLSVRQCSSIGDAILEEQEQLSCCIVVLGRRGLSHQEEFVFGSTTGRILRRAKRCAIMVVQ